MNKHTPGPWRIRENGQRISIDSESVDFLGLAEINPSGNTGGIPTQLNRANARLIAAAPDLLEIAEGLLMWLKNENMARIPGVDKLETVLKKAKNS